LLKLSKLIPTAAFTNEASSVCKVSSRAISTISPVSNAPCTSKNEGELLMGLKG
jgi:hypothetical protein